MAMKLNLKFDPSFLQGLLLRHGEKVGLAVAILLVAILTYQGVKGAGNVVDFSPEDLQQAVQQAQQHIENPNVQIDKEITDYEAIARRIRTKIREDDYRHEVAWNPPLWEREALRGEPPVFTVEDLRATGGHGIFSMRALPTQEGETTSAPAGVSAPTGMMGPQAATKLEGVRWVVVTGLVPVKKQWEAFVEAFKQAEYKDPRRNIPYYLHYVVERAEVDPQNPAKLNWVTIDPRVVFWKHIPRWASVSSDVVAPVYTPPTMRGGTPLVFPLGPLVGDMWGEEVAHPPEVPLLASAARSTMGPYGLAAGYYEGYEGGEAYAPGGYYGEAEGVLPWQLAPEGTTGMGPAGYPGYGYGYEGYYEGEEGYAPYEGGGMPGLPGGIMPPLPSGANIPGMGTVPGTGMPPGMAPGGMGPGGVPGAMPGLPPLPPLPGMQQQTQQGQQQQQQQGQQPAQPGQQGQQPATTQPPGGIGIPGIPIPGARRPVQRKVIEYCLFRFFDFDVEEGKQYRYRVKLYLFNPNYGLNPRYVQRLELTKQPWLETEWSDPTDPVRVPYDTQLIAGPVKAPSLAWQEPVARVVALAIDMAQGLKTAQDFLLQIGQWTNLEGKVRDVLAKATTSPYGYPEEGYMPEEAMEAMEAYGMVPPGATGRTSEEEEETFVYAANTLVLDIRGGEKLHASEAEVTAPGYLLVLDPSGRMTVLSELDDQELFEKYHVEEERKKKRKPAVPPGMEEYYEGYYEGMPPEAMYMEEMGRGSRTRRTRD